MASTTVSVLILVIATIALAMALASYILSLLPLFPQLVADVAQSGLNREGVYRFNPDLPGIPKLVEYDPDSMLLYVYYDLGKPKTVCGITVYDIYIWGNYIEIFDPITGQLVFNGAPPRVWGLSEPAHVVVYKGSSNEYWKRLEEFLLSRNCIDVKIYGDYDITCEGRQTEIGLVAEAYCVPVRVR